MKSLLAALFACTVALAQPIRLDSGNPHYFFFHGHPAVLITSGEHYGAVLNLDFNYRLYLDTLHADGLNLTRLFSGSYREVPGDFSIASNTLAPAPGRFIAPWLQRDGKFDLTQWDPAYFARLKDFVAQAGERGIMVEVVLFCPLYNDSMWTVSPMNTANNVNGIGAVARGDVLALKDGRLTAVQDAMVRKIVTELNGFDNIYYEICNEPYFGGVTPEWQHHIAETITQTESALAKKHLIEQNWANGSKAITNPDPLVSVFNFHYSRPPNSVAMNSALRLPIGNNETGFDGSADATYRIQGWDFLMAGGALYNNLDYSFIAGHEDGTFRPPDSTPGGGSPALRHQLGYLRTFFDEIPFSQMSPIPAADLQAPEGASIRGLEEPGKIYAVYVQHARIVPNAKPRYQTETPVAARPLGIRLPAGNWIVTWRDTKTGTDVKTESIAVANAGGVTTLTSPPYSEDIALITRPK
ncbi:MAG TPA: hypothetical protein VHA14_13180 [Bryobacteraceae bacterium]|nr:hypothetical protein [Bryobacteraceae bacterium]